MKSELKQIESAIAEVHHLANMGQGLDALRLRALEERREKLVATSTATVTEKAPGRVQNPPEREERSAHRGPSSYGVQTPVTVDAAIYARIDKPKNGKWVNLMIRTRNPKRTYYPAFSVNRGKFTDTDDYRRWKKRFPEQVEPVLELILQQLKAREGKGK